MYARKQEAERIDKELVRSTIYFTDGGSSTGHVFVDMGGRISDLMNDHRRFVPFLNSDGGFEMVNKEIISRIRPVKEAE